MSPNSPPPTPAGGSFPRVSGDEPDAPEHGDETTEFSPRERG